MSQVLVLNASYEPLNITSWQRAIVLMLKGKAEPLEEDLSHSINKTIKLPTVIRLKEYIRIPYREMPLTRKYIFQRDKYSCQYCGDKKDKLSIDHVIPRSRGGKNIWENVTSACLSCNIAKGNRTPKEANMSLKVMPHKPINNFNFDLTQNILNGRYEKWKKYIIG